MSEVERGQILQHISHGTILFCYVKLMKALLGRNVLLLENLSLAKCCKGMCISTHNTTCSNNYIQELA